MSNVSPKRNFYNFKANNNKFVMGSGAFGLVRKVSYQDIEMLVKSNLNNNRITNENIEKIATNKNNKNPDKYPFVMKIFLSNQPIIIQIITNVLQIRNYVYKSIENANDKKRFIFPLFKPIMLDLNINRKNGIRTVTFYRNGGDTLEEYVKEYVNRKLNQNIQGDVLNNIINESIKAINILHKLNVIHRDIKPQNMVVNEKNLALIDFDFAEILSELQPNDLKEIFCISYVVNKKLPICYSTQEFDFYSLIHDFNKSESKLKISNFLEKYLIKKLNKNIKKETLIDLFNITQENDFDLLNYYKNLNERLITKKSIVTNDDFFFMDRFALGLTLFIFIIKIYITIKESLKKGIIILSIEKKENKEKLSKIKQEIKSVSSSILELFKPPYQTPHSQI